MTPAWLEILTACIVTCILLMAVHWAPWGATVKDSLPVQMLLRCLAFVLPASYLFCIWQEWIALAAVWACLVVSVVMGAILLSIDKSLEMGERLDAAEREAKKLRPEVGNGKTGRGA
jgi:hypothetical protein